MQIMDDEQAHFWYVALVNCGHEIDATVNIRMLNTRRGCLREFSNDEIGLCSTHQSHHFPSNFHSLKTTNILETSIYVGLLYSYPIVLAIVAVLFAFHAKGIREMVKRDSLHPVMRSLVSPPNETLLPITNLLVVVFVFYFLFSTNELIDSTSDDR